MKLKATPRSKATNAYQLLNDVCRVVLEEPKRVRMDSFVQSFQSNGGYPGGSGGPACGTVGCIAGWVAILKRRGTEWRGAGSTEMRAINLLGDLPGLGVWDGLFSSELYNRDGKGQYYTYGTRDYARAVVRKIRAYQKAHKAALLAKAV